MASTFLSWPLIFLSVTEAYSNSIKRSLLGKSGMPAYSLSLFVLRHKSLSSAHARKMQLQASVLPSQVTSEIMHSPLRVL